MPKYDLSNESRIARTLLRGLNNPAALRSNPLVAHLFNGDNQFVGHSTQTDEVRALVLQEVESLKAGADGALTPQCKCWHAIVTRYDLARESREVITRDLGIGVCKFYYERRAALGRLAEALRETKPFVQRTNVSNSAFATRTDCAIALSELGRSDLSISMFRALVRESPTELQRATALSQLAEVLCDALRTKEAAEAVQQAQRVVRGARLSAYESVLIKARIEFRSAEIAWLAGRGKEAIDLGERACKSFLSICDQPSDEPRILLASVLNWLGAAQSNQGSLDGAVSNFTRGMEALERCTAAPAHLRAYLLTNLAFAQAIMPGSMRLARKTNSEALEFAAREGLLIGVSQAHENESQFQYWRGNIGNALSHSQKAQVIRNSSGHPVGRARGSILHARIEALSGHERGAIQRVRQARAALPDSSYLWILSQVIESRILLRLSARRAALRIAESAFERAEAAASMRGIGMAALALAAAHEATDAPKKAVAALHVAIPALEESAAFFPLAQALRCSARLTNNARHRADAVEIMTALKQ